MRPQERLNRSHVRPERNYGRADLAIAVGIYLEICRRANGRRPCSATVRHEAYCDAAGTAVMDVR